MILPDLIKALQNLVKLIYGLFHTRSRTREISAISLGFSKKIFLFALQ